MTGSGLIFRRKVPLSLRSRVGRVEIVRALRTRSRTVARLRARRMWLQLEGIFRMVRADEALTISQITRILHAVKADCDWADNVRLNDGKPHFDHHGTPPA